LGFSGEIARWTIDDHAIRHRNGSSDNITSLVSPPKVAPD
jgi:hypothetical protein